MQLVSLLALLANPLQGQVTAAPSGTAPAVPSAPPAVPSAPPAVPPAPTGSDAAPPPSASVPPPVEGVPVVPAPSGSAPEPALPPPAGPTENPQGEPLPEVAESEPAPEAVIARGVVSGRVLSADTKEAIAGVLVLVAGEDTEAQTDASGSFTIEATVGRHSLSAIHPDFSTQTLNDVRVREKGKTNVTFELRAISEDDVVITAPLIRGGVASELSKRRKATAVQDSMGAEDIAKTGDGSASSASKRIVGASIVGGQFLFVRGLGGRYSNVRLNGVPLPSTDPDLPGFQLDLFPTSLLSSLTVTKTFTPDIPGDFAGGSMNIETRAFPDKFTLTLSAGTSYNTETTGRTLLSSQGGKTDYLGYDDGKRALPDSVPEQLVQPTSVRRGQEAPEGALTGDDVDEISRGFANTWKRESQTAYPNLSLGLSVGDTFDFGRAGRLGFLFTGGYKYGFERYRERLTNVSLQGEGDEQELIERDNLDREVGEEEALLGGLGTISYAPVDNHRFTVVSLRTQNGVDTTSFVTGLSEEEGVQIQRTQFRFVERQLTFHQLLGEHKDLADLLTIQWQLNTAEIGRDQPDTRDIFYRETPEGEFAFQSLPGSGERLYTTLRQTDYGGGLDLTFKIFGEGAAKVGYMGRVSERAFRARRFGVDWSATDPADRELPADEIFDPDNVGTLWSIDETSQPSDGFVANQKLHAGYGMLEVPVFSWMKAIGGARLEQFDQDIAARAPFTELVDPNAMPADPPEEEEEDAQVLSGKHSDLDVLPAGSLIFALTDNMNLRGAYGGTVARPQTKELAPFVGQDYVRRRSLKGNPELERTFIHNFDLRWEEFPSPTEVFAVSLFYKIFEDPIEGVLLDQNGNMTFENIEGANNYGVEFEARADLELLTPALGDFSLLANLALIRSQVTLSEEQQRIATTRERPLAGQSPYVANLGFGWEPEDFWLSAYAFYNVFGRRISDVGKQGIPDTYEEAFHSVDANINYEPFKHFSLGLSGSNLLLQKERYTQGGLNSSTVSKGATFSLSAGLKY